jgi:hypothetical protein
MANFFTVLICAVIGAIFWDTTGFIIGLVIGILIAAGSANDKGKATSAQPQTATPAFARNGQALDSHENDRAKASPSKENTHDFPGHGHSRRPAMPAGPSVEQLHEYGSCLTHLYATVLSFYPSNDRSKVNDLTDLLKADKWITDKYKTLITLAGQLNQIQSERRDSPMLFQLHSNTHLERILRLPQPMRTRLAMQWDSLSNGLGDTDPKDCRDLVERVRQALRQDAPASNGRLAAEEFIVRSGDSKAISTLQEMRQNPSRYKEMLKSGANGNTVLKTAFGVFAGMLAADAVRAAITDQQMKGLLTQLDQDITQAGGVDNVPLHDKQLESFAGADSSGSATDSFDTGENAWDSADTFMSPVQDGSEAFLPDATNFNSDYADNVPQPDDVTPQEENDFVEADVTASDWDANTESESGVDDVDSSDDLAFDLDD